MLHGTGIIIVRLLIAVCALLFSHIAYAHSGTSDDQTTHSVKSTVIQSAYGLANQRYANTALCSAEHKTIRSQTYVVLKSPPQRLDKLINPTRDLTILENTPIDYLDFASPVSGLGSKVGFDAINKWPGETNREWGRTIVISPDVIKKVDEMWNKLF